MYLPENPRARPWIIAFVRIGYNVSIMKPKGNYDNSFCHRAFIVLKAYHKPSAYIVAVRVQFYEFFAPWIRAKTFM
jgi:hypothetical protein